MEEQKLKRNQMVAYWIMALVAVVGLADATYLTVLHLTGDDALCGGGGDCSKVLGSIYASFHGMPTAAFGVAAYFAVFTAAIFFIFGYGSARWVLRLTIALMLLGTLRFLYLQAFVLHAFCPFCLLSAALTFLLAGLLVLASPVR